jgi:DNA-binding protein YbaB
MFNQLKQLGDLKKMRDQAMQLQRELASEEITHEEGNLKIVMTGDRKVKEIIIDGESDNRLVNALNKAIEKSQQIAAKKLQGMSGGLGGLLGQ